MKIKLIILTIFFTSCYEQHKEVKKSHKELAEEYIDNKKYAEALEEYKSVDNKDEDYKIITEVFIKNLEATVYFKKNLPDSIFWFIDDSWSGVGTGINSYPGRTAHLFSNVYDSKRSYVGQIVSRKKAVRGNDLCLLLKDLKGNMFLLPQSELDKGILYVANGGYGESDYDEWDEGNSKNPENWFKGVPIHKISE